MALPIWSITPICDMTLMWGAIRNGVVHACSYCGVLLLTSEEPGFCCGSGGSHLSNVAPLPALPPQYAMFINDPTVSRRSRTLNLLFSFAAMETTATFPDILYYQDLMAIEGRVYHRIRATHRNSAVRWLLHDGFNPAAVPHPHLAADIPPTWIAALSQSLLLNNSFARCPNTLNIMSLDNLTHAHIVLQDM